MGVTALQTQVDQFTSLVKLNKLDKPTISRSLFLLESGSNDVFRYFLPIGPPRPHPDAYVSAMLSSVRAFTLQIHALGARRIALFSLGPVGCIPARAVLPESSPLGACHPEMNRMARRFNRGLEGIVGSAPMTLRGAVAVYGATYDVVQLFRKLPKRYRFADTGSACCGSGVLGGTGQCGTGNYTVCGEPEKFLFWDFFHPSQHAYALISKAFWGGKQSRIRPMNLSQLAELNVSAV
ncbi:GDSL esterase/lipase 6 [Acorus gramineus]|uniref:GDSL esterase/lipase 6 n=1 Tax=Acorus gramineus TaxID=55184 RepID=A0AAV9BYW0_ACOGR|nr:GDSL esterase/lipase 6 [Acorus gramineus]